MIVKVNTNDEAYHDDDENDEDVDDDIDISSDLSDDEESRIIEPIEPVSKRRKVNHSQQPKRQRGTKPIQVPKDESGNYIFPVQIGRTLLLSLGTIIPNENFYNQNYIFPVGYSIQRFVFFFSLFLFLADIFQLTNSPNSKKFSFLILLELIKVW